ncbi:hypothetical protein M9Y10_011853 [Tritrichomonas musculus]|uniref:Arrestin-like N-terminal domain-containing protein n=1 Tax=Tritrichomonas musculus TaxID=1915356 RepID=A0ABR2IB15_9EUKA
MTKKPSPLNFEFAFKTENPQPIKNIFQVGESFDATLKISSPKGNFSHRGIDFEFCTEFLPKGGKVVKYNVVPLRLSEAGTIPTSQEFQLPKCSIEQNCQTYIGESFSLRHWIRISVKKLIGTVDLEKEIIAYNVTTPSKKLDLICVRVAVEDSIRIDLITNRRQYEIHDVITGAAHFLLVNLKVKSFTVSLIAQEYTEFNGKVNRTKNRIQSWEITDGAPVKGEIVPFRLFLNPLHLNPSCSNPQKGYSVTHFLHFTVITMSNEKYFKALQIKLNKWTVLPFVFTDEAPKAASK